MLRGLKLYTVHTKPGSDHTIQRPVFLREGFNWFAFLFTLVYTLSQRLWIYSCVIFVAYALIIMAMRYQLIGETWSFIIQMGLQVIIGFTANDVIRHKMQKQGFLFQDVTSGESLLKAELRYFDRLVQA